MLKKVILLALCAMFICPFTVWAAESRTLPIPTQKSERQVQAKGMTDGLRGKTIVVDPGHGGSDPGAVGKSGITEKEVTLAISTEVQKLLEASQAKVVMTRTTDRDVHSKQASDVQELQSRVNIANSARADVFVSIHIDSFTDATASGTTTYFYSKSKRDALLASQIQQSMVNQLGLLNRGFHENNFYVLKHTTIPAVLAEVAFISNPTEENLLQRTDFVKKAAYGIFSGIKGYFRVLGN